MLKPSKPLVLQPLPSRSLQRLRNDQKETRSVTLSPRPVLPPALRVLLVEANMIIALDADDMLTRNGAAKVDIASDGQEALRFLNARPYDLAVLDLRMDRPDSGMVAARLAGLDIPFLFSTGYGETPARPDDFSHIQVIGKPFSEPYLLARVSELVKPRL